METILEVKHLCKRYKEHCAVDDVSFTLTSGEILCLLGPNGAGKTTTIHMIASLLKSDEGDILYRNESLETCRQTFQRKLGFVPQNIALYEEISAYENLRFFAGLYGLKGEELHKSIDEALAFAGLRGRARDKVKTFSTGMKRRLNIACGILHHPELVIMDEPTVGIDPQSRNHILESIRSLRDQGMTILYTTHYMEEVEAISDRIIIMDHGHVIAQGNKESLKESLEKQRQFVMEVADIDTLCLDEFYSIEGVSRVECEEHTITITALKNVENLDHIIRLAVKQKLMVANLTTRCATLETVFLNLTGRSLRD